MSSLKLSWKSKTLMISFTFTHIKTCEFEYIHEIFRNPSNPGCSYLLLLRRGAKASNTPFIYYKQNTYTSIEETNPLTK